MSSVGKSVIRTDAWDKVLGKCKFINDIYLDDMLYAGVYRSKEARADIKLKNINKLKEMNGIVDVITAKDVPGHNYISLVKNDFVFLAESDVKFYGEAVAIIVAEDKFSLELALDKFDEYIEYKVKKPVLSISESKKGDIKVQGKTNVLWDYVIRKGDIKKGEQESYITLENSYKTDYQEHAYLETQGMIAVPEFGGGIKIYGSMQCPFYVQKGVSKVLGIPYHKIRVIHKQTGGGFGGKEDMPSEIAAVASLAALRTKRPVKYILSREEDMIAMSKRHPGETHYRAGVDKTGRLTFIEADYNIDSGPYLTLSGIVLWRGTVHAAGTYRCPNVKVDSKAWATNKTLGGAFRGFGIPQMVYANELMIDELAVALGMDPFEFRYINSFELGDETATGHKLTSSLGIRKVLKLGAKLFKWSEKFKKYPKARGDKVYGIGMSSNFYGGGLGAEGKYYAKSGALVNLYEDGSVLVGIGNIEMGQGAFTVIAQIAASVLGVKYEQVRIIEPDTAIVPDSGPTVASRTTVMSGNSVRVAAEKIRNVLLEVAADMMGVEVSMVEIKDHKFVTKDLKKKVKYNDVVSEAFVRREKLAYEGWYKAPKASFDKKTGLGAAYPVYNFSANFVEIEVDKRTGQIRVIDAVAVHDIGKVVNPMTASGQVEGGFTQGMGLGLYEKFNIDNNGKVLTDNFSTYIIPTTKDMPKIKVGFIEEAFDKGPFGAKGLGELPLIGPAPAIANALYNALRIRIREIPLLPEIVLAAIKDKEKAAKRDRNKMEHNRRMNNE